jgi:serine/threonine-protein kinase HipA
MLQAIGRDCVAAVQLLAADKVPGMAPSSTGTPLGGAEIEALPLRTTRKGPLSKLEDQGELRSSPGRRPGEDRPALAPGPMDAVARCHSDHAHFETALGTAGAPPGRLQFLCEEPKAVHAAALRLWLALGRADILRIGSQRERSVARFGRHLHSCGNCLMRLPQEDFCQVKGLPSHLKYEADGGPGLADLAGMLQDSIQPKKDVNTLLRAQVLHWLMASPESHAKIFSIRGLPQNRCAHTQLCDVMSIWPAAGKGPNQFSRVNAKMAMAILGRKKHDLFKDIQRRHFKHMVAKCFLRADAEIVT